MRRWLNTERERIHRIYGEIDTGYLQKRQKWIESGHKGKEPKKNALDSAFSHADGLCLEILEKIDNIDIDTRVILGHDFNSALKEFDSAVRVTKRRGHRKPKQHWKAVVHNYPEWLEMTSGGGKYLKDYDEIKRILVAQGSPIPSRSQLNSYRKKLRDVDSN